MSFGSNTVWEVQPGVGSDTANGGGFDLSATFATDLTATSATGSSPVVSSASYNFITRDGSQYLFIKSGTNWIPGLYPIVSTAGNNATLNAAIGAVVLYVNGQLGLLNTTAGCATTASPTGGTWGIDYSRSATPVIAFTDIVIGATTTQFTSVANPAGPHLIGNIISMTSGSGFTTPQWVEVTAFTLSGLLATCDKSLGTTASTGGHGGLGGCLATIGKAGNLHIGSNVIFVLGGSTSNFSNSSNAAGGKLQLANGSTGNSTTLIGYVTNRTLTNTDTPRPILQMANTINNANIVTCGSQCTVRNIECDNGNSSTGCAGFHNGDNAQTVFDTCKSVGNKFGINCDGAGSGVITNCEVQLSNESGAVGINGPLDYAIRGCYIHGGTGTTPIGITGSAHVSIASTVIANITGSSAIGITAANASKIDNVAIYNVTTSGIDMGTVATTYIRNVYLEACGVDGIKIGTTNDCLRMINCAGFNNGANYDTAHATTLSVQGFIACSASALTAPGSGDFSINNTVGGGALLRGQGFPITFPGLSQVNNHDIGAYQHIDPTGSGGPIGSNMHGGFCN